MLAITKSAPVNEIRDVKEIDVAPPSWKVIAARRQAEINNAIPPEYLVPPVLLEGLEH
jgi:hypothetical protein